MLPASASSRFDSGTAPALRGGASSGVLEVQHQLRLDCAAHTFVAVTLRVVRVFVTALLLSALFAGSVTAQAGSTRESKADANGKQSEYDRLLKEALSEFGLGNWTEARALFERAHELKPSARTLRAIGLSAFEEKSYATAVASLTAALKDQRQPLSAKQRTEAENAIDRALNYIAEYELVITPEDAKATVTIDSREPVMLDGRLLLDPGKYLLEVTAEGYEVARQNLDARPREKQTLHIALALPQSETTPAQVAVTPNAATSSTPKDTGLSTQQWIGIGVGAAGIATLGVSAAFGLTAMSKADDAGCNNGLCPNERAQKLNNEALDAGTISTVTFIAGAVTTAAGVVLLLVPLSSDDDGGDRVALQPFVSPDQAGITLGGRW
jgi:tetratricopeptide (TPR) repeat protein